jgi:hypothetical protein
MQDQEKKPISSAHATPLQLKPVKFIHEKGAQYRVYHADGAWGVINNFGNVQIDFCVERPPMPSAVIHPVKQDGNYTGEQTMEGIEDKNHFVVVRDFQCGVVLSFAAAVQVHSVLEVFIKSSKQQMDAAMAQLKK